VSWALLLGGGTALGAFQVPIVERLVADHGWPSAIAGVSVGAVNASLLCEGRLEDLRATWEEIDGAGWFQRPNLDLWNGLFSLRPLRRKMERAEAARKIAIDTHVGIFDLGSQVYRSIDLADLAPEQRIDAVIASSTQPGIHERASFEGRWCVDGGVAHVLPLLPGWQKFEAIRAISCSPIGKARRTPRAQKDVAQATEQAGIAFEHFVSAIVASDVRRLRRWSRRVPVSLYAPSSWEEIGDPFDASRETIEARLRAGARGARSPVTLGGR